MDDKPRDNWPHVWWVTNPRYGRQITSDEEELLLAVTRGFMTGDLLPLRDYLAAGYPLDVALRREIIAAVEGSGGGGLYTMVLRQNGPGRHRDLISRRRKARRDWEIAEYFRGLDHGPGEYDSAIKQTADHFKVGTTVVTEALRRRRR